MSTRHPQSTIRRALLPLVLTGLSLSSRVSCQSTVGVTCWFRPEKLSGAKDLRSELRLRAPIRPRALSQALPPGPAPRADSLRLQSFATRSRRRPRTLLVHLRCALQQDDTAAGEGRRADAPCDTCDPHLCVTAGSIDVVALTYHSARIMLFDATGRLEWQSPMRSVAPGHTIVTTVAAMSLRRPQVALVVLCIDGMQREVRRLFLE